MFILIFGIYIKKPILEIISLTDITIYNKFAFIILFSVLLGFLCICLFKILNYSIYRVYNNIKNQSKEGNSGIKNKSKETNFGLFGILWILPLNECNNATSLYWSSRALKNQHEIRTISTVINKLDQDNPRTLGESTRLSGFMPYLLEKYKESLEFDRIARKNQYRTMILNTREFTRNDSDTFPNSASTDSSYSSSYYEALGF